MPTATEVDPVGSGWAQSQVRYFLYAFLYVVFAVDAVYLFPWATVVRKYGWPTLAEMGVFRTTGTAAAIGVGVAYLAGVTLLPAVLVLVAGGLPAAQVFAPLPHQRREARSVALVHGAAAQVVAVFGDVGQVAEVAEGADDGDRLLGAQVLQQPVEHAPGARVGLQTESHREAADALDQLERGVAFLLANDVAEDAPEQADVLDERPVLLGGVVGGVVGGDCGDRTAAAHRGTLLRQARGCG